MKPDLQSIIYFLVLLAYVLRVGKFTVLFLASPCSLFIVATLLIFERDALQAKYFESFSTTSHHQFNEIQNRKEESMKEQV